jgi:hypothetical protein
MTPDEVRGQSIITIIVSKHVSNSECIEKAG